MHGHTRSLRSCCLDKAFPSNLHVLNVEDGLTLPSLVTQDIIFDFRMQALPSPSPPIRTSRRRKSGAERVAPDIVKECEKYAIGGKLGRTESEEA